MLNETKKKSSLSNEEKLLIINLANELEKREFYKKNPADWFQDILDIRKESIIWSMNPEYETHIWDGDADPIQRILHHLANGEWVAAESAVGTGKSFICGGLVLWFLACWPETALVHTIAPRKEQLSNIWKHIENFWPRFKIAYPDAQLMASDEIRMFGVKSHKKSLWRATGTTAQVGASEEVASNLRGSHSPDMLFIVDETPGVDEAVLKAIELTSTDPHNLILYIGNPTGREDTLHRRTEMDHIHGIRMSALDHPNCVKDDHTFIRGATSSSFIKREINNAKSLGYENYEECPDYMINIRGICPIASIDTLVPPNLLEKAEQWFNDFHAEYLMTNGDFFERPIESNDGFYSEGQVRVYELPKRGDQSSIINNYIVSADIAGSSSTGDWHGAILLNRTTKAIAATLHMRGSLHNYIVELYKLAELFKVYNYFIDDWDYPIFAWETNGVGAGFAGDPILQNYPSLKIYRKQSIQKINGKPNSDSLGWGTYVNEREEMTKQIREWSKRWKDSPEIIRDIELFNELKHLVWNRGKRRYEASKGNHDDMGFSALGIALSIDAQYEVNGSSPRSVFKVNRAINLPSRIVHRRKTAKKQFDFENIQIPKHL